MNPILDENMANQTMVADRAENSPGASIDHHHLNDPAGPHKSILRRLVKTLMMVVLGIGVVVFALYKKRVDIPALNTSKIYASLDSMSERVEHGKEYALHQYQSHFGKHEEEAHHEPHKILVTSPVAQDVDITQEYVCQIHSRKHIEVCALENGYLEAIPVREGQAVKKDEKLFSVNSVLYKAKLDAEVAERDLVQLELNNTKRLADKGGVSQNEVRLYEAKLARAQAKVDLALAELNFATVKAPFDGIIDRLHKQEGSLVKEGEILTTLSDNSVMWVYFNVTEKRYLEYMAESGYDLRLISWDNSSDLPASGKNLIVVGADHKGLLHIRIFDFAGKLITDKDESQLPDQTAAIKSLKQKLPQLLSPHELTDAENAKVIVDATSIVGMTPEAGQNKQKAEIILMLANHDMFPQAGKIGAIEANFNNETGNISFRADFPNSHSLLRHGQTGTVKTTRTLKNAIVIPQRATFENLAKRYVYILDKDKKAHQREIVIDHELDDIFVIKTFPGDKEKGLDVNDVIVLEGIRQVKEGDEVEGKFLEPKVAMKNMKVHAE